MLGLGLSLAKQAVKVFSYVKDTLKAYYRFYDTQPDFLLDGSTSFDGTDDYIDTGVAFSNTVHTISGWFKLDNVSGNRTLFCGRDGNDDGIRVLLNTSQIAYQINTDDELSGTSSISANVWTHVACTYDGTTQSIYLNGSLSASQSISRTISTTQTAKIGRTAYGTSDYMLGMLANIGLWDRALSASEVESIYWRGSHSELQNTELTNLVSWYDLSSETLGNNLITNGDFPSGLSDGEHGYDNGDGTVDGWTGIINDVLSLDSSTKDGSANSLKIVNSSGWLTTSYNLGTLTDGKVYRVSYDISVVSGGANRRVGISNNTNSGSSEYLSGASATPTDGGGWESGSFTFQKSTTETSYFKVMGFTATIYLDNIVVQELSLEDSQGSNNGAPIGVTTNSDSYSGESPFKPRIQDKAAPKMAVQLADGSTSFDGVDDLIEVTDDSSIQNIFDSGGTISAWVYINSDGEGNLGRILNKRVSGSGWIFYTVLDSGSNVNIRFFYEFSSSAARWDITAPKNQWIHLALTYDSGSASNDPVMYLNGSSETVTEVIAPVGTRSSDVGQNLFIGNQTGGVSTFDGKMANVAIHSSALTQTQIQELMFTEKYSGLSADLKTNLVSWYDMGSSTNPHNDLEGSNHGTNNGATVNTGYTYSPHGVVDPLNFGEVYSGRALSFGGVSDYVSCGDIGITDYPFTYSAWFKTDGTTKNTICALCDADQNVIFYQFLITDTGLARINARNTADDFCDSSGTYNDSQWHHGVAIFASATDRRIYIDGVADGSDTSSVSFNSGVDEFSIGVLNRSSKADYYDDEINHVKVFNIELSESQIRQLYTKPETVLPTGVSASNLKLDLPMQEGSGSYVYDGSGNQNHGTIVGATWATGQEYGYQASLVRSNTPMIFDSTDDSVNVGNAPHISKTFDDGGTVAFWAYVNSDGGSNSGRILNKRVGGQGWLIHTILEAGGNVTLRFMHEYSTTDGKWSITVPQFEWSHVVITYDSGSASNDPVFYLNGVSQTVSEDVTPVGSRLNDALQDLYIGNDVNTTVAFDGIINEVAIWEVALDADAVTQIYNSGVPLDLTSDSGNYDNSDSLVGYWRNDSNTTWTDRANTGVASFDGTDDFFDLGSSALLSATGDFTISAWAKHNNAGSSDVIFGQYIATSGNGRIRLMSNTSSQWQLFLGDASGVPSVTDLVSSTTISNNVWYHVVATRSGNDFKIYVNGSLEDTHTDGATRSILQSGAIIGMSTNSGTTYNDTNSSTWWNGQLASFNLFNVALTASEVSELYAIDKRSSISGHSQFSNCVASYLMGAGDGDSTSTIQDQTSNNNDGTVNGAGLIGYNDGTASGSPVEILIPEGSTEGRDNQGYYLSDTTTISNGARFHESEYIKIQPSEIFEFAEEDFTVECWVKLATDALNQRIMEYRSASGSYWWLYTNSSTGVLRPRIDDGTNNVVWNATTNLCDDTWHHICVVFDRSSDAFTYIDGTEEASPSITSIGDMSSGSPIYIATTKDINLHLNGLVDEVRIYNKALSADEVSKNYNNGKSSHQ